MEQQTTGRHERTAARALALLGSGGTGKNGGTAHESTEGGPREIGASDESLIAACIAANSSMDEAAATLIASDMVQSARVALTRLREYASVDISQFENWALESVLQVRGRPAVRMFGDHLDSLAEHPGSDYWKEWINGYEDRIVHSAAVTGAAMVSLFSSGLPAWVQGSAWLVSADRVVTNRHVLLCGPGGKKLVELAADGTVKGLCAGCSIVIEFAADNRSPSKKISRLVTGVRYIAEERDPVDIAVLTIEPYTEQEPLTLAASAAKPPQNLFVVGHPGLKSYVPEEVLAVFGKPDGKKRVSFGKLLPAANLAGNIGHDASTIGGYSGGPVVGISDGTVAGLHFYGDPISGNLAISAAAIRAHAAHQFMVDAS